LVCLAFRSRKWLVIVVLQVVVSNEHTFQSGHTASFPGNATEGSPVCYDHSHDGILWILAYILPLPL
jgi:hypothetical protein